MNLLDTGYNRCTLHKKVIKQAEAELIKQWNDVHPASMIKSGGGDRDKGSSRSQQGFIESQTENDGSMLTLTV